MLFRSVSQSRYTGIAGGSGTLNIGASGDTVNLNMAGVAYNLPNNVITSVDYTANNVLAKLLTVDGSGSGLDADLLDGLQSTQFVRTDAATSITAAITSSNTFSTTSTSTANIFYSTSNGLGTNYRVGDDAWLGDINLSNTLRLSGVQSANNGYIVFGNADTKALGRAGLGDLTYGNNTVWHAGNDGAGSTLDADLLDGQHGSYYQNASNISTGTLILARGGTNAALTATAGAVAYSNSTSIALTAVGTSGYVLLSGGTSAPTWSSQASLSVGTANNVSGGTVTATSGTFSSTLGVTGAATFANTVGITGTLTTGDLNSTSGTFSSTLGVTGAATFSDSVFIAGNTQIGSGSSYILAKTDGSLRLTKELEVGNTSIYANTQTISAASSNTIIDAFYTSEYSTSKYVISYKSTSNTVVFGSTEILVMHNGSTVVTSKYSIVTGKQIGRAHV